MTTSAANHPTQEERLRALRTALAAIRSDSPAAGAYRAAIARVLAETGGQKRC